MGVPSFYRWLIEKYPNIVVNAKEEKGEYTNASLPNPNGMEFDNFYLDMNAIIHPCFHPQDDDNDVLAPVSFDEVFHHIFEYIDRLFNIVRPRKLLFLAIDGVAPRAKMNQQRARRFRTAKDAEIVEKEEERLRREFLREGKQILPKQECEVSDSNIITPGTEFMHKLSKELQSYIRLRINNDPGWEQVKVILSDANVPGEGEHKIMSFIRHQRTFPDYNPNTRHCVYGLDADLIMLVLATHEVHFSILREDVLPQKHSSRLIPEVMTVHESGSSQTKSRGWFKKWDILPIEITNHEEQSSSEVIANRRTSVKKPYQFLHIWIVREYLELDMVISSPPEKFVPDFERIVDDFIFMCFFNGNDFLPHMPTLEIREGAIDLLMHVYKTEFKNFGGYLVDMQRVEDKHQGYIKLKRVEKFILLAGSFEEKIFKKRSEMREMIIRKLRLQYERANEEEELGMNELHICSPSLPSKILSEGNHSSPCESKSAANNPDILSNTEELKNRLKQCMDKLSDTFTNGGLPADKVKLSASGHKERYYNEKFGANSNDDIERVRKDVVIKYTEGLCWVILYYFSEVPSWTWYYPYHYGPFASDLKGLAQVKAKFQKGLPFKPFEQLMGVLPPRSARALPPAYQKLMTDADSSIVDFYPKDFVVDCDGKRFTWQGICKLPFIEETRLLAETRKLECELKGNEIVRNSVSSDQLFLGSSCLQLTSLQLINENLMKNDASKMNATLRDECALNLAGDNDVSFVNNVVNVLYKLPSFKLHVPRLLEGVNLPEKTIFESDICERQLWHQSGGRRPNTVGKQNSQRQCSRSIDMKPKESSFVVIMEGAGVGWGGGRGKISAKATTLSSVAGDRVRSSNGVGWGKISGNENNRATSSSSSIAGHRMRSSNSMNKYMSPMQRGLHASSENWTPSGFGRGRGTGQVKPQLANNSVWQTKTSAASTFSPAWRQNDRHLSAAKNALDPLGERPT